jgi:hypothetical protein
VAANDNTSTASTASITPNTDEDDEPVDQVRAAFERGEKHLTVAPSHEIDVYIETGDWLERERPIRADP